MKSVKTILLLFVLVCGSLTSTATHNRAGEIIYKRIPPYSRVVGDETVPVYHYSITVIRYTDHGTEIADRCEDTVYFGDGERGLAPRVNSNISPCNCGVVGGQKIGCGELLPGEPNHFVKLNIYTITHYYAGPGSYLIRSYDPNRNEGVKNIPSSVNVPFYIESLLIITTFGGPNSSPVFAFPPIDKACVGQCFEHNPGAYDPDPQDSLSFEITMSRGQNGQPVPGYSYPPGQYGIDPVTGELKWCSPTQIGEYNLAFIVKEWRKDTHGKYYLTGYVLRDMQVIVNPCGHQKPPVAVVPPDTCVEAGARIEYSIPITDPDGTRVTVTGGGGPFEGPQPRATLTNTNGGSTFTASFTWETNCEHVRQQQYLTTLKLQDNDSPVRQVSFHTFGIRVVPPSIKDVVALPAGTTIRLNWSAPVCRPVSNPLQHYLVYRKDDCDSVVYEPCGNSPTLSGYKLIAKVGSDSTLYVDDNGGDGLVIGQKYNYVITAVYKDGSESFASAGVCTELKRDVPVLLNVDVLSTSASNGSIYVRWTKPLTTEGNLDTIALPGPYKYRLMHKAPGASVFQPVFTATSVTFAHLDTNYTHAGLNTVAGSHEYQVEFTSGDIVVGNSQRASSVFLFAEAHDERVALSWFVRTPWENSVYRIYRRDPGSTGFMVIGSTSLTTYVDSVNVKNYFSYCYMIESEGAYSDPMIFSPLINRSQDSCIIPIDLTPPCSPTLHLAADCPEGYVSLNWTDVTKVCNRSADVRNFMVFHKQTINDEYIKVAEGNINSYELTGLTFVSGCYAVQALDTNGNSSPLSAPFCIDNCPVFELPNIFTPNKDDVNDYFQAIRVRQIKEINLFVVDRWGTKVYSTTDPYFKWDGISAETKMPVSDGTYFYVCDVYEPRLRGIVKRTLRGTVHLSR